MKEPNAGAEYQAVLYLELVATITEVADLFHCNCEA